MNDAILAINEAMSDAAAAQEAGDYAIALRKVESAWMRIVVLPDSEFENEKLEWSRDGVKQLMEWLQKRVNTQSAQNASSDGRGSIIRPVPIHFTRDEGGRL